MLTAREIYNQVIDTLETLGHDVTERDRRSVVEYLKDEADPDALAFDPEGVIEEIVERIRV